MSIGDLASTQGGHITREQLLGLALTRQQIEHRLTIGRLIRVHHGIYAVGHLPSCPHDRAKAALLTTGQRSALAGWSAAALYGLEKQWREPLELISAGDRRPPGLRVTRASTLLRRDIRAVDDLRVTSPARTALDLAARTTPKRLTRVINELRMEHRLTERQLKDVTERNPRHPGAKHLRPLIRELQREPTRSELEEAFLELIAEYELPTPKVNFKVAGKRVDAYFPEHRLIVELDGYATHGTKAAFSRDRAQDAYIFEVTGIPTIRYTYDQTTRQQRRTAKQLATILERRW
jgi:very-short-patch-repair endonuclease